MADFEVTHIERDGDDLDRRIDKLAGPAFGVKHIDDVIAEIQAGTNSYHVIAGFWPAHLEVKWRSDTRRHFLQTIPNGQYDDNLYSLPEISGSFPVGRPIGGGL